jgi:hypothetical protein
MPASRFRAATTCCGPRSTSWCASPGTSAGAALSSRLQASCCARMCLGTACARATGASPVACSCCWPGAESVRLNGSASLAAPAKSSRGCQSAGGSLGRACARRCAGPGRAALGAAAPAAASLDHCTLPACLRAAAGCPARRRWLSAACCCIDADAHRRSPAPPPREAPALRAAGPTAPPPDAPAAYVQVGSLACLLREQSSSVTCDHPHRLAGCCMMRGVSKNNQLCRPACRRGRSSAAAASEPHRASPAPPQIAGE